MALIKDIGTSKVSLGALAADTVFTCVKGMVGITTDDAADDDADDVRDYYPLSEGQRLVLTSGVTVKYVRLSGTEAALHHMPA